MGNLRVLYLHALESGPNTLKHKYLDMCFDVYCPKLRSGEWMSRIRAYAVVFVFTLIFIVAALWVAWGKSKLPLWVAIVGSIGALIVQLFLYRCLLRYCLRCCLREAVEIADECYVDWEPDIIVGASFGGVVACHLESRKTPLLLLAPANELYYSWAGMSDKPDISPFPYVTIVHGALDQTVPLQDSVRLCESAKQTSFLEVMHSDDHRLTSLGDAELRELVNATIHRVDPKLADACVYEVQPQFPQPPSMIAINAARAGPGDEAGGAYGATAHGRGPRPPRSKVIGKELPEEP